MTSLASFLPLQRNHLCIFSIDLKAHNENSIAMSVYWDANEYPMDICKSTSYLRWMDNLARFKEFWPDTLAQNY
jgi:hypothetical protein